MQPATNPQTTGRGEVQSARFKGHAAPVRSAMGKSYDSELPFSMAMRSDFKKTTSLLLKGPSVESAVESAGAGRAAGCCSTSFRPMVASNMSNTSNPCLRIS